MGLKALEPSEATRSFVFLCHTPDLTLLEEQLVEACLGRDAREPLGIGSLGLSSCAQALVLAVLNDNI